METFEWKVKNAFYVLTKLNVTFVLKTWKTCLCNMAVLVYKKQADI